MMLLKVLLAIFVLTRFASATDCHTKYHKIGCYRRNPNVFPEMLVNHRAELDWHDFQGAMKKLACECAYVAKNNKFTHFAIGFYGECHGTKEEYKFTAFASDKSSLSSNCIHDYNNQCNNEEGDHKICSGKAHAEYVYSVGSQELALDGGLSEWSEFTPCSVTCGVGMVSRERACNNPLPKNCGSDCKGPLTETKLCKLDECPVDGGFTPWSSYGSCLASCGTGTQMRKRSCNNPIPAHGGKPCSGSSVEIRVCNAKPCLGPEYCAWNYTPFNSYGYGSVYFLNRHNMDCKEGKMITSLRLQRTSGLTKYRYRYRCCNIRIPSTSVKVTNPFTFVSNGSSVFLDRQNVKCPNNSMITQLKLESLSESIRYIYTCSSVPQVMVCTNLKTQLDSDNNGDARYLYRHLISCPSEDYGLNQMRLVRGSDRKTYAYHYRCCKPVY